MVKRLLSDENITLLIPKIIWIDYCVIPILTLIRNLRDYSYILDQLFFLEFPRIDIIEQLIRSNELYFVAQNGFSTVIIHIPNYFNLYHDFQIQIREFCRYINVIMLMDKLILPRTKIKLIKVE